MENLNPKFLNMKINNSELHEIPNFKNPILRLYLLNELTEKNFIYPAAPYILYDEEIADLLKNLIEMARNPNKARFDRFISILKEKHYLFLEIEKIFPYHLFKKESHPFYMILYWIPFLCTYLYI